MNGDDARKYFLSRPEAIEDFPFRFDIHVFKIGRKMFGTLSYREHTVTLDGSIPSGEIERMIDRSYGLVVRKLKKTERIALEIKHGLEEVYR